MTATRLPPELARGLAARLRDALDAAVRLASFSFEENGPPPPELIDGQESGVARDFVLRAVAGASDPSNHRLLVAAHAEEEAGGVTVERLCELLELPRLAITERVNELIQLGLAARDLKRDTVVCRPAGAALTELLVELEGEVAGWLAKRKRG